MRSVQKPKQEQPIEGVLASLNRALPFTDEGESGVISGLLHRLEELLDETAMELPDDAFYHVGNRIVYQRIKSMHKAGIPITMGSLTGALRDQRVLEKVGGAARISEYYSLVPITSHFLFYRQQVRAKWLLRQLIGVCANAQVAAHTFHQTAMDTDVSTVFDQAEEAIKAVRDQSHAGRQEQTTAQQLTDVQLLIQERVTRASELTLSNDGQLIIPGLSTGLRSLDDATNGLCEGHTWIISGGVSDGKTALTCQMLLHNAKLGIPACYYLTEDSATDWWTRLVSVETRIPLPRLLRGTLSEGEQVMVGATIAKMQTWPLRLRHLPELTDAGLLADMRVQVRKFGARLFAIDYIQNITITERPFDNSREDECITWFMKRIAALTSVKKVTTIVLSQLNDEGKLAGARALSRAPNVVIRMRPPVIESGKSYPGKVEKLDYSKRELLFGKARMSGARGNTLILDFNGETLTFR